MRIIIVIAMIFIGAGCAHVAKPIGDVKTEVKEVRLKNYKIGEKYNAYVGEPIVRVKEYSFLETQSVLKATNDFNISGGLSGAAVNVNGRREQAFDVIGTIEVNGIECKTIKIPGSGFVFGINQDGSFSGVAASFNYMHSPIKGVNVYQIKPDNTLFVSSKRQYVLEDNPYTNFEIIYSGISDGAIHLLYREYTTKDLIRPAFSQELTYPAKSKTIRYRKYQIKVEEVTAEKIVYTVVNE